MDDTTRPPVRLQAISTEPLSLKGTQSRIDEFLSDLEKRSTPVKGLDTTITSQLVKLKNAIKEERIRDRRGTQSWYGLFPLIGIPISQD
ncbi:hypothetical protein ID866_7292 [Astraeus odoratus]|nr:hypothetical protein ID866_7292 [Astraeus odoratus]